jgi:L-threonylcarbamoyladenylate synthase
MTVRGREQGRARLLPDDAAGREAAIATLRAGGLVAMPTDTVYGVGVALDAPDGLSRLFAAKERPLDRAIVLLVADLDQAASVGVLTPAARALADRFWPGGLTLVLAQARDAALPALLTAGAATIGVRLPDHDCPRALALALGPLPVTSANISGQPEARDVAAVLSQLGERIDLVLDGGPARGGTPSTVVDCSGEEPKVLRPGAISAERMWVVLEASGATLGEAVRSIGLDAVVEAARRNAEYSWTHDDVANSDDWTVGLGYRLGDGEAELGWEFVCRLVEVVEEDARGMVGASQLEDFCAVSGGAFIERIEEQARRSPAFREALGQVWPQGDGIPPAIYARIRAAASPD